MGGGAQFLKRIPRINFPQRHPKPLASVNNVCHEFSPCLGSTSHTQDASSARLGSDVPSPPKNPGSGGKASLQPERKLITPREVDAIILGGCI